MPPQHIAPKSDVARLVADALDDAGGTLTRRDGRRPESGLLEVQELGPALKRSLIRAGAAPETVALNYWHPISDWTRPSTEIDLVVLTQTCDALQAAIELKVWDISHQLFDLAKICCLLGSGVPTGFLVCVARAAGDFDHRPGGVLFPSEVGETRAHRVAELIATNRNEWSYGIGKGRPEPTSVPTGVSTTAIAAGIEIAAYPGHSARAVQVEITDAAPVPLRCGWPVAGGVH